MNALTKKLASCFAFACGLAALAVPALAETGSYGYLSVVEGSATLMQAGTNERSTAEVNQPVLAGDRLWVPDRSRVEILLADRNILRVDGGSELILERLAASPDRDDRATVVRLLEGNLQLIVTQDSLGDELPRVETPNATIYPQNFGSYRVTADREGWSELVVRRGTAQVVTDRGTEQVRADEEAVIDGDRYAGAEVREAGAFDSLERWARQLDDDYSSYASSDHLRPIDDNLRYAARPLARYGDWVYVDGSPYWRPRVATGWRPYWQGRWAYTPAGLTWISYEPWGWVPYHYGSWDYLPAYGWVWQPGYVWSPAWVYWYWGPSYVGWCPTGYYTRYYGPRFGVGFGFRYGVYGWAGGDWGYFDRWNFVHAGYFDYRDGYRDGYRNGYWDGRRDVPRYAVPIEPGHGVRDALQRGIITTDTRPLKPGVKNPDEVLRALRSGRGGASELPDVTSFIARKPQLPDTVLRTVRNDGTSNLDGTPLKPSTLGRDRRAVAGVEGATPPSRPRIVFGDDGPRGASPSGRSDRGTPLPTKPETRAGGSATETEGNVSGNSGRPRIVIEKPARPGSSDASARGAEPAVRERPSRPAPEADGGAPRPRRVEIDTKPGRSSSDDAPVVRERPSRPAPEADGGAPRPDRGDRGSRSSSSEDRPQVRERRPPVDREQIQRQIEIDRQQQDRQRYERPREDSYVRPEPRVEPRTRTEPRVIEPSYRQPEPRREPSPRYDRGSESRPEPRVEPRSQPQPDRGARDTRGDRGDRGDRGNRGNDRPQVRERRPPAD
ncbi:MAG TPA: DUF6600 domain-containing protein [Thermoanaerobaculia bacterium]|jgi:hypothetical protein|nr:DUF6600 domain-containing protein [Thermoanaerobaculia bacterium]